MAFAFRTLLVMLDSTDFRSCESAREFKQAVHYWAQRHRVGISYAAKVVETA